MSGSLTSPPCSLLHPGLAASLGMGAASELIRRQTSSEHTERSIMMSEGNIRKLVSKLSQMRGAALKIGQFLSIQGERGLTVRSLGY